MLINLTFFVSSFFLSWSYYLPGVSQQTYKLRDRVELDVNALRSPNSVIPYDYYYPLFGFCKPLEKKKTSLSFGSILLGDRVFKSDYELLMEIDEDCKKVCEQIDLSVEQVNFLIDRISEKYYVHWLVDSFPAARKTKNSKDEIVQMVGFNLGVVHEGEIYLNTHHDIEVTYHKNDDQTSSVVGVLVKPSYKSPSCGSSSTVSLKKDTKQSVIYTYSVKWVESKEEMWATRWDNYLQTEEQKIHWFSLINSFAIVIFLTIMVTMILIRALHKDISRYNTKFESVDEPQEEYGWKLVHADVFRTPKHPSILSVFVGNGIQILLMSCVILTLAILGFLSPSMRGSLATVAIVFYVCFGFAAGYTSSRLYKMMGGEGWKKNIVLSAFLIPGSLSFLLILLNFFLIAKKSSAAVPFGTLSGLLAMWILISAPLSFIGSYLGFKKEKIAHPLQVNQIPRTIPHQSFYLERIPSILLGGVLPFGAIFIELYFIMNSIWFNRIYYVFGFLSLVFVILCFTCAQVTILMCYFHLCAEDHRWWWRSFFTSGCSALYAFFFGIFFFYYKLDMVNFISGILYFGWTSAMCFILFLMNGTVGFLSCLWFIRKIYSAIRVD